MKTETEHRMLTIQSATGRNYLHPCNYSPLAMGCVVIEVLQWWARPTPIVINHMEETKSDFGWFGDLQKQRSQKEKKVSFTEVQKTKTKPHKNKMPPKTNHHPSKQPG
jgi:hypothetical protein